MPAMRTYKCSDCEHTFDHFHMDSAERLVECPKCEEARLATVPGLFAITGNKSRAVDLAQKIAEEDFGLTNMNDQQRVGDTAAMGPPPVTTAEMEQRKQQLAEIMRAAATSQDVPMPEELKMVGATPDAFWKGGTHSSPEAQAALANGGGPLPHQTDNVGVLEKGREQGITEKLPMQVMARADMKAPVSAGG